MPATSPQSSSPEKPKVSSFGSEVDARTALLQAEAELVRGQARKVDQETGLVEDSRRHRRAETRDLEAKTGSDARKADAEISLIKTQQEKVAGEVAQQPLEEREREARIEGDEASVLKDLTWTLGPMALVAIGIITSSIDPGHLAGSYDLLGDKFWLLPSVGR